MNVQEVDLVGLVAVIMVFSVVLIPVIGLTARFALKPVVESLKGFFETKGSEETIRILERRVGLLEQQLEAVESGVRRLEEAESFDRRLREGSGSTEQPGR